MFELLLAALRCGDTKTVITLLGLMPLHILLSLDEAKSNVVHYLARFNLLDAIKEARDIIPPEKFTAVNLEHMSPFVAAVYYNHPVIVQYFRENKIDDFCTPLHRDAFLNSLKEPITSEQANIEDVAGFLPIHYAVAAGNKEAVEVLLEKTPEEKLKMNHLFLMLEMAIELKHVHLFSTLKNKLGVGEIFIILDSFQKRFIDVMKNKNTLLEKIEEKYENPGELIKLLIDMNNIEAVQHVILKAASRGCPKILTALLDGFQQDNLEARHETIDTLLHVVIQVYVQKFIQRKPNLLDKDILDLAIKACLLDIEAHPEWLAPILMAPVKSDLMHIANEFLKRLSIDTKKKILSYKIPDDGFGMTLLHLALRYKNSETFMVLMSHGGSMLATDERGMSVQDLAARMSQDIRLSAFSPKIRKLFELQRDYFKYLTDILDTGVIDEALFVGVVSAVENLKKITQQYDALKDEAFMMGFWKILLKLMKTDFDNPLTKKLYLYIKHEIQHIRDPEGRMKNSILALRNSFINNDFEEAIYQLNNIALLKDVIKSPILFNHANVPQVLLTRMALIIFNETKMVIPRDIRSLLNTTSVAACYNTLVGVFCLHLVKADNLTEGVLTALYKKMSDLRLQMRKGDNNDLKGVELNKKRDHALIVSDNFMEMMQETHNDISIFYQFIQDIEKTLWGAEFLSIEKSIKSELDVNKLSRLLMFYHFKHETMELLSALVKEFKRATDFSSEFSRIFNLPEINLFEITNILKNLQKRIDVVKRLEGSKHDAIFAELMKEKIPEKHKKQTKVEKNQSPLIQPQLIPSVEDLAEDNVTEESKPRYHYASQEEDRFLTWAEMNNIEIEKIYLKRVGEKKRIPIWMPKEVLNYMRSFGSDGCWLTGGAPRDLLLGFTPKDWDFVVDRTMAELQDEFKKSGDECLELKGKVEGKQTLVYRKKPFVFENTPCPHDKQLKQDELRQQTNLSEEERRVLRSEIIKYYFNVIMEDEEKRDFPINALAINYYSYFSQEQQRQIEVWQLIDDMGGYKDLMNRQINLPLLDQATELFWKDPIRPLRAIRHACRLGLWGADELIEVFNQGGVSLFDALFAVNDHKLREEYLKLKETFKEDLPKVLDLFSIKKVFQMRGMMSEETNINTQTNRFFHANESKSQSESSSSTVKGKYRKGH